MNRIDKTAGEYLQNKIRGKAHSIIYHIAFWLFPLLLL